MEDVVVETVVEVVVEVVVGDDTPVDNFSCIR